MGLTEPGPPGPKPVTLRRAGVGPEGPGIGLLDVDLATGVVTTWPAVEFGGPVAALWLVLAALPGDPPTDDAARRALAAELPTALVASTVAGVAAPGLARVAAVGVSPLSGGVAETRAEGPFAAGLRAAGCTGLVLRGRADRPVYVLVTEGGASLHDAGDLWSLDTWEATAALRERHGPTAAVAVAGPAGERGVPYASVVTCGQHPLPRLGFGAVWGAKFVKAVVCVGTARPPVADPAALAEIGRWYARRSATSPLTTWQRTSPGFGVWPAVGPAATMDPPPAPDGVAPCPGCPTDCVKTFAGAGLHQEALAALGRDLGSRDTAAALELNARCLREGVDPVSYAEALRAAGRRPFDGGEWPAPGPDTVKSVALPPFDPREQPNLGLGYAVAPFGPRYDVCEHDVDFDPVAGLPHAFPEVRRLGVWVPRPVGEIDVQRTAVLMALWSGLDALGVCVFAATPTRPLTLERVGDLVAAVTGERPDVLALGYRRLQIMAEINQRLGVPASADTLPDRYFDTLDRDRFAVAVRRLRQLLGWEGNADEM
ncbi:aldehyde ferredoxin oxidoreductase N-terminal domain-containing protein [Micromonospora mirobrigensis]|uniref:Aldehyde:ferredoxin oxidoreductase n=1 Tax=Micromonospora mirobrigensis TaxID=262898 RepID=A0A1C4YZ48_9ACTN|nr:aldehyde ferredoxin oxidoreductase N-terminal domain-containing protein [Micromonospora mirobrigensis]SCF25995.1 Aldehyde:ferredoxin oxidoreductase [Micromonospora mirobrigensis]